MTYADLLTRIRAWQAGLDALGVGESERVAVVSQNAARLLEVMYAVAPTTVEFRDAIPRTATGKVQKFKLREPYWAGHQRRVN